MMLIQLLLVLFIIKGYTAMICEQDSYSYRDDRYDYHTRIRHVIKCHNVSLNMEELLLLPDADASKQATYQIEFLQGNISILHSSQLFISSRYRIYSMHIQNCLLDYIEPGAFSALYDIKDMNLAKNNLTAINVGIFNTLTSLTLLNISYNQIKLIENDSFYGMDSLTVMDLSNNKLEVLSAFTFRGLKNLTRLNISLNAISELDDYLFKELIYLKNLNLNHNSINFLYENTFFDLVSLTELFLQSNNINWIDRNCFRNLQSLIHLDLSQNSLTTLHFGTFTGLNSLEYLDISHNNVAVTDFYYSLSKLRELSINNNNIRSVDIVDIKQYCQNLRLIVLLENPFECSTLAKIYRDLIVSKIDTIFGTSKGPNINGIACIPTSTTKTLSADTAKNFLSNWQPQQPEQFVHSEQTEQPEQFEHTEQTEQPAEQSYQTVALELNKIKTELATFMKDIKQQLDDLDNKIYNSERVDDVSYG